MNTEDPKIVLDNFMKESYVKPEVNVINLELEGSVLVSSNPTGSGEDMPWGY